MGNVTQPISTRNIVYNVPIEGSEILKKRSAIYRSSLSPEKVIDDFVNSKSCRNAWDIFQRGVTIAPDGICLGTRERLPDGTYGDFNWKTYREVEQLALQAGSGLLSLPDAVALQHFPDERFCQHIRFLAVYSKNREEWIICEQACNAFGITIVPLYDTLGVGSTLYILEQTQLRTVVASDDCALKLLLALQGGGGGGGAEASSQHAPSIPTTNSSAAPASAVSSTIPSQSTGSAVFCATTTKAAAPAAVVLSSLVSEKKDFSPPTCSLEKNESQSISPPISSEKKGALLSATPEAEQTKKREAPEKKDDIVLVGASSSLHQQQFPAFDSSPNNHDNSQMMRVGVTSSRPEISSGTDSSNNSSSSSAAVATTNAGKSSSTSSSGGGSTGAAAAGEADEEGSASSSCCSNSNSNSNRHAAGSCKKVSVQYLVLMGDVAAECEGDSELRKTIREQAASLGIQVYTWNELLTRGKNNLVEIPEGGRATPDTLNTVCYTSGTTGRPKGVMMTHRNFVATIAGCIEGPLTVEGMHVNTGDTYLSYLPLAHVYERALLNVLFSVGGSIGFNSGDVRKLLDDVQALEPAVFSSVPRLFNRIYDRVFHNLKDKSFVAQALFNQGLHTKLRKLQTTGSPQHGMWDKVVFSKTKSLLGSKLRWMLVGSAPLDPAINEKIRVLFSVSLVEGYGMTESMAASFISHVGDKTMGHIGGCCPSLEFCLFDISEEMPQYSLSAEAPAGELCMRGPVCTPGYFRNEEETKKAIDEDGWLHSGDIALILPENNAVKIIDRMKNIFKLAQGEYIAPEKIENVYTQASLIGQIFVFGYSTKICVVGIVVPDAESAQRWAKQRHLEAVTVEKLCADKEFHEAVEQEMSAEAKKHGLKGFEVVKNFKLEPHPFTVENNLLTPTLKLKRFAAREKYQQDIDKLYEELDAQKNFSA